MSARQISGTSSLGTVASPPRARRTPLAARTRIEQLAILGEAPAFSELLHVGRPNVGDRRRLLARLGDMLDRRWLSNDGPYVRELEARLARRLGVRHCLAVCNATAGLQLAIHATGLSGEVIVPSFTFVATAHALAWHGITPVFADISAGAPTLDPAAVERLITPRTTGIIGVHVWGRPCDVEGLDEVARRHGLVLLFDAAHALGCSHRGRVVGGFGRAEVFSFHATKFFNTFEGGAITTDDDEVAERIRLARNFGFAGEDNVIALGINAKMSEAAAAMGLGSLEGLERFIAVNRTNAAHYQDLLRDCPGLRLVPHDPAEQHNYQYVVAEIDEGEAGLSRDAVHAVLRAENVRARRYFHPGVHRMEPYRSRDPGAAARLPQTERLAERVLCLPTGTAVGRADIAMICRILRLALTEGPRLARRLADCSSVPGAVAGSASMTLARDPVAERVRSLLTDVLSFPIDAEALADWTPLRGQGLGLDSVDLVALIVEMEQAFDVSFEDDELAGAVATFGTLVAAVRAKIAGTSGEATAVGGMT